jgi:hypothetical protein
VATLGSVEMLTDCAAICRVGRFGVELDSATGEISPPVFPLELTWAERSGVPSDGRDVTCWLVTISSLFDASS